MTSRQRNSCVVHSMCHGEEEAQRQLTCVVVKELNVAILLSRDGDWKRRMTQHFVDFTWSVCEKQASVSADTVSHGKIITL